MSWLRYFRRAQRDQESAREIEFYLDQETEDNLARGMKLEEARAAARKKFGNTGMVREEIYRINSIVFLETIWQDLIYALRTMRKNPAFAATAVLTLALGIGGNTAMFSIIRTVLLKPLAYREPNQLVRISVDNARQHYQDIGFSQIRFEQMRQARSFSEMAAFFIASERMTISGSGAPEALKVARVSANFLSVLGIEPALGRSFLPEEDISGGQAAVMISNSLWRRRFGGDPSIVGRTVPLDSTSYTIVGVLPPGFQFPVAGVDAWVPRPEAFSAIPPQQWRTVTILVGLGRLKPQVSLAQARAELDVMNRQFELAHPAFHPGTTMRVALLRDQVVANVRTMLWTLFGAVGFVLLIACANIASLLLARASSRSREFAVRAAIGAPRRRLIGQLLVESLLLSFTGGVLGVGLAGWALRVIAHLDWLRLPRAGEIGLDPTVLGFTVALSIAAGILFGLFPSIKASRPDLAEALRASGAKSESPRSVSTRGLLVTTQIALSVVLLIGAALLLESFARLIGVDPGFQPANLLTMQIGLPNTRYPTIQKQEAFYEELLDRIGDLPGIRAAAVTRTLPTMPRYFTRIAITDQPPVKPEERPEAQLQTVSPGYFSTLRIPLRRGREFDNRDKPNAAGVSVIINETLARHFWPAYPRGQNPVGQHLAIGNGTRGLEIVGIVADVHEVSPATIPTAEVYVPLGATPMQAAALAVRTDRDPTRFANAIRAQMAAIDREEAPSEVKTMEELLAATVGQERLGAALLGSFAAIALLLALIGIYGVIAYSVEQRKQELGIRMALGAQQSNILRLVLGQALVLALVGIAAGITGAYALTRLMKSLLFDVSATDPATFAGIAVLFVIVALAASYIPARRAARIDPMIALRYE